MYKTITSLCKIKMQTDINTRYNMWLQRLELLIGRCCSDKQTEKVRLILRNVDAEGGLTKTPFIPQATSTVVIHPVGDPDNKTILAYMGEGTYDIPLQTENYAVKIIDPSFDITYTVFDFGSNDFELRQITLGARLNSGF